MHISYPKYAVKIRNALIFISLCILTVFTVAPVFLWTLEIINLYKRTTRLCCFMSLSNPISCLNFGLWHLSAEESLWFTFWANKMKEHLLKILVIGDGNVGKSSFVRRYVNGQFNRTYKMTVGGMQPGFNNYSFLGSLSGLTCVFNA